MVDKVALAKTGLKLVTKGKKPKGQETGKQKPGENPFYYNAAVVDRYGREKLDMRGRPITKKRRKDENYYVNQLGIPVDDAKVLLKMKKRAMLMDGGREVLGFRIPLGLSTVLTFCVPELGDGIDGLISYVMVVRAGKITGGLGKRNHALMTLNVGRDAAIGAIPFVGAIVDMFYRANTRNSNLLEKILIERVKKLQLDPEQGYESSSHANSFDGMESGRSISPEDYPSRRGSHHGNSSRYEVPVQNQKSKSRSTRHSPKQSTGHQFQAHSAHTERHHSSRPNDHHHENSQGPRFISARDL